MKDGISAMFRFATFCEDELALEIVSFARGGLDPRDSFSLEVAGKHLLFAVRIDGGWLDMHASMLDSVGESSTLWVLNTADGPEGWETLQFVVSGMVFYEVKSLKRPIAFGEGANSMVIG